ncbi:Zinc finger CCHC domain-containing protein 24 [Geodia barretti]|uniref:Zinc finger CCHC domain-containing protein 24 n=1 Tax=Geodia barretti TaxID=519541 RepID=A0AA35U3Z2_GEOBA|nr:Zinc finger CCHC domain-containing protein 24 [Geodia barretti]
MSSQITPHQGPERVFGEFRCPECGRTWSSGNSWANMGQECMTCKIMVYPHTQTALQRPDKFDDNSDRGPHRQDLCEKCMSLGHCCRPTRF